jgi:hypothetical protein
MTAKQGASASNEYQRGVATWVRRAGFGARLAGLVLVCGAWLAACGEDAAVPPGPVDAGDDLGPVDADRLDTGVPDMSMRCEDADGDGARSAACGGDDCDDADPSRYPGNTERCDADDRDEDCDPTTYGVRDLDGDGEVDAQCCNVSDEGTRACGSDCDDMRAGVSPLLPEVCDGRDNDCDGDVDEGVLESFHPDADADGFGDAMGTPVTGCFRPDGYADNATDCNDADSGVNPGLGERCDALSVDENCDGIANPPSLCACTSGESRPCDEPGVCAGGTEPCIDGSWGACSIGAGLEICNGIDDDCDGATDESLTITCYADADNDGYAAAGASASNACADPSRVAVGGCPVFTTNRPPIGATLDCADGDSAQRPGAVETCDGVDENCDGMIDEGLRVTCYLDLDNDEYPAAASGATQECRASSGRAAVGDCPLNFTNRAPAGLSVNDCADGDAATNPGVMEICDGVDRNCSHGGQRSRRRRRR